LEEEGVGGHGVEGGEEEEEEGEGKEEEAVVWDRLEGFNKGVHEGMQRGKYCRSEAAWCLVSFPAVLPPAVLPSLADTI
jgi:hypothetical protein